VRALAGGRPALLVRLQLQLRLWLRLLRPQPRAGPSAWGGALGRGSRCAGRPVAPA